MTKIKVGVIGVGALGWHHARLYKECDQAELVGIYDLDEESGENVAEKLATRYFKSPVALLEAVDAVSIAVPAHLHFEIGQRVIEAKKHILMEKPLTEFLDHGRKLLEMAKENDCIIQVGHVERFNPIIAVMEEKLTDPRFIEVHRLSPYPPQRPGQKPRGTEVGVVLDLMIHDLEMILNLVDSEVELIDVVGVPILSSTEDIANVRLRFENGCVANLTASRVTNEPVRKMRIFQSDAYVSLDYQEKSGEIYWKDETGIQHKTILVDDHNALLKQLEHFLKCVAGYMATGNIPAPKVSGEQGFKALELAVKIREKIQLSS